MAEQPSGLELRARLLTVPFSELVKILSGKALIANLPASGYIRSLTLNLKTTNLELMVIDMSYAPVLNLGDMPTVAAEVQEWTALDSKPKGKRK